jgi:hypothetical protein
MTETTLAELGELVAPPEVPVSVSLRGSPLEFRIALLSELGMKLHSDGVHLVQFDGTKVLDPYVKEWVRVDRMMILPGSVLVLDDNLVSVACYMAEHGDAL